MSNVWAVALLTASKKKRLWLGGHCPLGYDVRDRQVVINPKEAKLVGLTSFGIRSKAGA
jgi:hypothetical protein